MPRDLPKLLREASDRVVGKTMHRAPHTLMSIPVNRDRDVDVLLCEAANKIEELEAKCQ